MGLHSIIHRDDQAVSLLMGKTDSRLVQAIPFPETVWNIISIINSQTIQRPFHDRRGADAIRIIVPTDKYLLFSVTSSHDSLTCPDNAVCMTDCNG